MEKILGKNWMTTLAGIVTVIGGAVAVAAQPLGLNPGWGVLVLSLGAGFGNLAAKDFNSHSTQAEVKVATEEKKVETVAAIAELKEKK